MDIKEQLKLLDEVKQKIKESKTVKKMFKEADVSLDVIDLVPMTFGDLEVSARTQHGIIVFNNKLKKSAEELEHYMVHELTHILQQCFSDGPTMGSNNANYLDNPYEEEGFNRQTEFLSETKGKNVAKKYIDKVLDHHDVPEKEKEDKKDALLSLSSSSRRTRVLEEFLVPKLPKEIQDQFYQEESIPLADAARATGQHLEQLSSNPEYAAKFYAFNKEERRKYLEENPDVAQALHEKARKEEEQNQTNLEGARGLLEALRRAQEARKK